MGRIQEAREGEAMITAIVLLGLYAVIYTVVNSLLMGEQRNTIRGLRKYSRKLEHENKRMREGND